MIKQCFKTIFNLTYFPNIDAYNKSITQTINCGAK
jgi:hypothetical protein